MDKFEKEMLEKIDNSEKLSRREIIDILELEIERNYGDNRRWSRSVTSICNIGDRYFSIYWEQGLTEYQEDEYDNQPVEVKKHTYNKTIEITEWKEI